jgi:uncharacterized membrane protein
LKLARVRNAVITLRYRAGDFIEKLSPVAQVWGCADSDDFAKEINDCVITGNRRTPRQDLECAIEELSEVAVRSLSPGINDPFTAVGCVNWLGASLSQLVTRKLASEYLFDETNVLRVIRPTLEFSSALDSAFRAIRHHARGSFAVSVALLRALERIAHGVTNSLDGELVEEHARMVKNAALDVLNDGADQQALLSYFDRVLSALHDRMREGSYLLRT